MDVDAGGKKYGHRTGALVAALVALVGLTGSVPAPATAPSSDEVVRVSADGVMATGHGVAVELASDSRAVPAGPEMKAAGHPTLRASAAGAGVFAGFAARPSGGGYWLATADGGVTAHAGATHFGDFAGSPLNAPVVGIASTASGNGYWLVAADGGIFSFGDAAFFGSMGNTRLNQPVIGMSATTTGQGYWLFASDGGIFTFGNAPFRGSTGGMRLRQPVVGMTPRPDGEGYWLVASDGGVFSFNVPFFGSTGAMSLNAQVVGALRTTGGNGYWLVGADGGVFSFGDARFYGSTGSFAYMPRVVGMSPRTGNQEGYVLVGDNGTTWEFGPGVTPAPAGACSVAIPPKPAASSAYAIGATRSDGSPVRWSACAPIPWVFSTPEAPAGALPVVQAAFDRAAAATGLPFTYAGTTTARAGDWVDGGWTDGSSWKPIVVDFQPSGGPHLCGSAGCAWSASADSQIVAGAVIVNKNIAAGWSPSAMMGPVVLHEIGHIAGLDHFANSAEVMNGTITQPFTDYSLGDRNGLWLVGSGSVTLAKRNP